MADHTDDNRDAARRAAVAALPDGSCPMLVGVTEVRARTNQDAPWKLLELPEGSEAQLNLARLMMRALDDPEVHQLVDLASRHTVYRHPDPCLVCAHHAAPGPRVYAVWHTQALWAAEWEQGQRDPDARDLFELPNMAAAEEWAAETAAFLTHDGARTVSRFARLRALLVPADPTEIPEYRLLLAEPGAELWLWNTRPATVEAMRCPDRLLSLQSDGAWATYTGTEAAALRPVLEPPAPPWSPFRIERADDGRELGWYDDGAGGLLMSVLSPGSDQPAVRVTAQGEEEMSDCPRGLRVFGRHVGDRPQLSALAELAPEFADLAPTRTVRRPARR
ncbi:hypothetical protein CTZ27_29860 [Streptomyces griseocarneus]|nr:hypothetical protein CTZ27_29860 [Streptomyces griseocarneus]